MFINWREQTIRAPIRVHEVTSHLSGYGETCTMPGNLSRAERIFHLWHRIGAQKKKKSFRFRSFSNFIILDKEYSTCSTKDSYVLSFVLKICKCKNLNGLVFVRVVIAWSMCKLGKSCMLHSSLIKLIC